jgi:hypothetical protein
MADIQVLVLELRRTRVAVVVRGAAAVSLAFKFSNIEIAKRAKDTLGEEMTADVCIVDGLPEKFGGRAPSVQILRRLRIPHQRR